MEKKIYICIYLRECVYDTIKKTKKQKMNAPKNVKCAGEGIVSLAVLPVS